LTAFLRHCLVRGLGVLSLLAALANFLAAPLFPTALAQLAIALTVLTTLLATFLAALLFECLLEDFFECLLEDFFECLLEDFFECLLEDFFECLFEDFFECLFDFECLFEDFFACLFEDFFACLFAAFLAAFLLAFMSFFTSLIACMHCGGVRPPLKFFADIHLDKIQVGVLFLVSGLLETTTPLFNGPWSSAHEAESIKVKHKISKEVVPHHNAYMQLEK